MTSYLRWLNICAIMAFLPSASMAEGPKIEVVRSHRDVFCNMLSHHQFAIRSPEACRIQAKWQVFVVGQKWNQQAHELSLQSDQDEIWNIEFEAPPVRDGLVLDGMLRLMLLSENGQVLCETEYPLSFFPKDPFATRSNWLKEMDLMLLDSSGATKQDFEELGIPFRMENQPLARKGNQGYWIIGEGIKWDATLKKRIESIIKEGGRVLWLASGEGQLDWPCLSLGGDELPDTELHTLRWLDGLEWKLGRPMEAPSALGMVTVKERSLQVQWNRQRGWPFLVMTGRAPGGRLIGCGVSLHREWIERPMPRYLLAYLLEQLSMDVTE